MRILSYTSIVRGARSSLQRKKNPCVAILSMFTQKKIPLNLMGVTVRYDFIGIESSAAILKMSV